MTLAAFRNLYRIKDGEDTVAFVTAISYTRAEERYVLNGGARENVTVQQISSGYPVDECKIIA